MVFDEFLRELAVGSEFRDVIAKDFEESAATQPMNELYFLRMEYIRSNFPLCALPSDILERLELLAGHLAGNPALSLLAWHCFRRIYECPYTPEYGTLPDFGELLGDDAGLFHILLAMASCERIRNYYRTHGLPLEMAEAAPQRVGEFAALFRKVTGHPGMFSNHLYWFRLLADGLMFRIGRLEYEIAMPLGERNIRVFRHRRSDETVILSRQMWFDADGEWAEQENAAFGGDGFVIDQRRGLGTQRQFSPDENWEEVLTPDGQIITMHIPGGGGMTPEKCRESLRNAFAFFECFFPETPVKAAFTVSWMFHHHYAEMMPDSNVAKFQRILRLFPCRSKKNAGFRSIFARNDDDYATYPRTTTLERVMLDLVENGGVARNGGMLFLKEDLKILK